MNQLIPTTNALENESKTKRKNFMLKLNDQDTFIHERLVTLYSFLDGKTYDKSMLIRKYLREDYTRLLKELSEKGVIDLEAERQMMNDALDLGD